METKQCPCGKVMILVFNNNLWKCYSCNRQEDGSSYREKTIEEKVKSWKQAPVAAIAQTLIKKHDFDPDRAVAIAYWFSKGKMITIAPGYYYNRMLTTKPLSDLTKEDAAELLKSYAEYKNSSNVELQNGQ